MIPTLSLQSPAEFSVQSLALVKIPREWKELLHGWPGRKAVYLEVFVRRIDSGKIDDSFTKAYQRLFDEFTAARNIEVEVADNEWSVENEKELTTLFRKLQGVYCRKPL